MATLVVGPLLLLPLSFVQPGRSWQLVATDIVPEALRNTLVLAVGVAAGTLVLGTALAVLVTFYDFPLRRLLEWAVVLPLAIPAYVLVFVLLGQYDRSSAVQRALRWVLGPDTHLPEPRSAAGAVLVLTLVLYPYVYLLARASLIRQSRGLLEAARGLGCSQLTAVWRVALPLARPALAGGTALAVMEAVADFGAVNLLNYRTLTDAIYRVWYGAFDRRSALQLGAVLLGLVLLMLAIERSTRRHRSIEQRGGRGDEVPRRRLRGWRAGVACALPALLVGVVVVAPVAQLTWWAVGSLAAGTYDRSLATYARSSVLLGLLTAILAVVVAVVVRYAVRLRPNRLRRSTAQAAALGYAVPGSVAASAVFLIADEVGGLLGVVLTGSLVALLAAYLVRFAAIALQSVEARMAAVPLALDSVARSLGAGRTRVLGEIHLPLLAPGIATGALLVFIEVVKELPATVLLRPFGLDTLSVAVWEATRESLYETAALPALCLVAVGLIPIVSLIRLTDLREHSA